MVSFDDWSELTDGYDYPAIAALCKTHRTTVIRWRSRGVPYLVQCFLRSRLHGELLDPAWSGWRIQDGLLFPPDMRRGFSPGEVKTLHWWQQLEAWRQAGARKSWSTSAAHAGQYIA